MMLRTRLVAILLVSASTVSAVAQTRSLSSPVADTYGPAQGQYELSLGGNGVSNRDLDGSAGGGSAALACFFTTSTAVLVRQSINYSNPEGGGKVWNGSTRLGIDKYFGTGGARLRPFAGANLGRIYGDSLQDTWAGGLDAGLKYYVLPQTFVYGSGEYQWFFDKADQADNSFNDGQYVWSVGLGFVF